MNIFKIIEKHKESIKNGQYSALEQDLVQTSYDLQDPIFVDILKKLTELNPDSRIPVFLTIVDCYINKHSDILLAYNSLSSLVNKSMQDSSLTPEERRALEILD